MDLPRNINHRPETILTQIAALEKRLKALETAPQLPHASLDHPLGYGTLSLPNAVPTYKAKQQFVAANESTSSGVYTTLTTSGPSVSVSISSTGQCLVVLGATVSTTASGFVGWMGFQTTDALSVVTAPSDARACRLALPVGAANFFATIAQTVLLTGLPQSLAQNDTTFTAYYKADGVNNTFFGNRFLFAIPL